MTPPAPDANIDRVDCSAIRVRFTPDGRFRATATVVATGHADGAPPAAVQALLVAQAQDAIREYCAGVLAGDLTGVLTGEVVKPQSEHGARHLAELTEACARATSTWMPGLSVDAVRWLLAERERLIKERDHARHILDLGCDVLGAFRKLS